MRRNSIQSDLSKVQKCLNALQQLRRNLNVKFSKIIETFKRQNAATQNSDSNCDAGDTDNDDVTELWDGYEDILRLQNMEYEHESSSATEYLTRIRDDKSMYPLVPVIYVQYIPPGAVHYEKVIVGAGNIRYIRNVQ